MELRVSSVMVAAAFDLPFAADWFGGTYVLARMERALAPYSDVRFKLQYRWGTRGFDATVKMKRTGYLDARTERFELHGDGKGFVQTHPGTKAVEAVPDPSEFFPGFESFLGAGKSAMPMGRVWNPVVRGKRYLGVYLQHLTGEHERNWSWPTVLVDPDTYLPAGFTAFRLRSLFMFYRDVQLGNDMRASEFEGG